MGTSHLDSTSLSVEGEYKFSVEREETEGSSGFCVETRSILIEYPQNSPKSLVQ